jgi:RNA polymerase sigma factor (sigma-70 family)
MSDVTRILARIETGDPQAAEQLLPLVYDELRKLAAARLAQEKPGQTLQATALVHEAYLRLVEKQGARSQESGTSGENSGDPNLALGPRPLAPGPWNSRGHFFAAAAEAMRRILVESARKKQRLKRGGGMQRVELEPVDSTAPESADDLLALDAALQRLAADEPLIAQVVQLRYFAGLTIEQVAEALGISVRTANRHWAYAKAWLFQQLGGKSADTGK